MILKILALGICGPTSLDLRFNDGSSRRVEVLPLLSGPMFVGLRRPDAFAQVKLNPVTGTVEWPNGADLAPEALRGLPDERVPDGRAAGR